MRSPFVSSDTVRIDLPDGLWWEFKRRLSYGDKLALRRHFIAPDVAPDGTVRAKLAELDLELANVRLLLVASVAWNFPDGAGGIANITEENILCLDEDTIVNPVLQELGRLYGPISEPLKN